MHEITLRFDLTFGRRFVTVVGAVAVMLCAVPELESESVTLSTYYPAPSGVYTNMITTQNTFLARDGGNVGIGTTNARDKLHVNGGIRTGQDVGAYLNLGRWGAAFGGSVVNFVDTNAGSNHPTFASFQFGGTEAVRFRSNGSASVVGALTVGGTGSFSDNVTVGAAGNNSYIRLVNSNACSMSTAISGFVCNASEYATFWQGLNIEGWSYQNRGGQVIVQDASSGTGYTQVWGLNTDTGVIGWMTLNKDDSANRYYCCPR